MKVIQINRDYFSAFLKSINDVNYKPRFVKFIGENDYHYFNLDYLKSISTVIDEAVGYTSEFKDKDRVIEISIDNSLVSESHKDNDTLLKYFIKLLYYDINDNDKKYLHENRNILYQLISLVDKYNMPFYKYLQYNYLSSYYEYQNNTYCTIKKFIEEPYSEYPCINQKVYKILLQSINDYVMFINILSDRIKNDILSPIMEYIYRIDDYGDHSMNFLFEDFFKFMKLSDKDTLKSFKLVFDDSNINSDAFFEYLGTLEKFTSSCNELSTLPIKKLKKLLISSVYWS